MFCGMSTHNGIFLELCNRCDVASRESIIWFGADEIVYPFEAKLDKSAELSLFNHCDNRRIVIT